LVGVQARRRIGVTVDVDDHQTSRLRGVPRGQANVQPRTNMTSMASLDFAFWDVLPHTTTGTAIADDYDAHIALAQRLEALGWHSYFTIEHQNAPQGVSAPSVYLTAVARETTRLRLGAMMWQLPFYHPLRLAQDVAMLDQLSR